MYFEQLIFDYGSVFASSSPIASLPRAVNSSTSQHIPPSRKDLAERSAFRCCERFFLLQEQSSDRPQTERPRDPPSGERAFQCRTYLISDSRTAERGGEELCTDVAPLVMSANPRIAPPLGFVVLWSLWFSVMTSSFRTA